MADNVAVSPGTGLLLRSTESGGVHTMWHLEDATQRTALLAVLGSLTETPPGTDLASSGLNGLMRRGLQQFTALLARLPASIGPKTAAASFSITTATDEPLLALLGAVNETAYAGTGTKGINGLIKGLYTLLAARLGIDTNGILKVTITDPAGNQIAYPADTDVRITGISYSASGKTAIVSATASNTPSVSASFTPLAGRAFSCSVWGATSSTANIERSYDGGTTWLIRTENGVPMTYNNNFSEEITDGKNGVLYRINVTAVVGIANRRIDQ